MQMFDFILLHDLGQNMLKILPLVYRLLPIAQLPFAVPVTCGKPRLTHMALGTVWVGAFGPSPGPLCSPLPRGPLAAASPLSHFVCPFLVG